MQTLSKAQALRSKAEQVWAMNKAVQARMAKAPKVSGARRPKMAQQKIAFKSMNYELSF
jgi:hypothetical protein